MQSGDCKTLLRDLRGVHSALLILHSALKVSVIGLAPIRPDLKGRLRELLCIHGQKWSPRLVSRQRLLVFSEALICLSYSGEMVVPAGNAPASSGYQPGALLLSYETSSSRGFTPKRRIGRKVTFGLAVGRMRIRRFGL